MNKIEYVGTVGEFTNENFPEEYDQVIAVIQDYAYRYKKETIFSMKRILELTKVNRRRDEATSYGTAWKTRIDLHTILFEDELKDELKDTFLHELAHIMCDWFLPEERGHGAHWKKMMEDLGRQPNRCGKTGSLAHKRLDQYAENVLGKRAVEYTCPCCGKKWTRSRRWSSARHCNNCHKPGHPAWLVITAHPNPEFIGYSNPNSEFPKETWDSFIKT